MTIGVIPKQLRNERFILADSNKRPIEASWPTKSNYDYETIQTKQSAMYGVLCGHNNLVVIDIDNKNTQEQLIKFPEMLDTFIVQTANKKLYHIYFKVENVPEEQTDPNRENQPLSFRMDNKEGERIIDFQAGGTQVIGPGSSLPDGRSYEVVSQKEIATIDFGLLVSIVKSVDEQGAIIQGKKKQQINNDFVDFDDVCNAIKHQIKIPHILAEHFGDEKFKLENPTKCPLGHTSEGGKSFHSTGDVWNCFHCGQSGNVIQLYQKIHKVEFKEAKKILAKKSGLSDDVKKHFNALYKDPKTRNEASELLAEEIKKIYHVHTVRNDLRAEMWVYRNGVYVPNGRTYCEEFCQITMGDKYNTVFSKRVIDKLKAMSFISEKDFFINEDLSLIPIENGILNVVTKELMDFSYKYKFFNKLPIVYDKLAKCEKFKQFLTDVLPEETDQKLVQELFGFLLYRDYKFKKAFLFNGDGDNGKSVLIQVMEKMLGKGNTKQLTLEQISSKPFLISQLFGMYANMSSEINDKELDDTTMFKSLTGHDAVTCDRKFLTTIDFTNFAKMIFSCNQIPSSTDDTDAFYNRWIVLDFAYKFVNSPDPSNPKEKLIDTTMVDKVTTPGEMMGVLNWALEGYDRLMKQGKFTYNASTADVRQIMKRKSNSFHAFLMDEVEKDEQGYVTLTDIEKAYNRYCIKHQISKREINKKIKEQKLQEYFAYKKVKKINDKTTWVWEGIRLKFPEEEAFELDIA